MTSEEMQAQQNAEGRAQAIKTRRLEIRAIQAEWKRDFFVHGVDRPLADRLELAAEYAQLELEARQVGMAAEAEKVARRKALNAALLPQLLQLLRERGLEGLIEEATARAAAATAEVVQ